MEIRNLMEDAVFAIVGELFDLEEREPTLGFCTCPQCRLDVACFVLNRIKPEYIVSGRGLAYSEKDMLEKVQRRADIITIAREGWSKVSHRPRENSAHGQVPAAVLPPGPAFNIPAIMGRAFNGLNFEPLALGTVLLLLDGKPAPMVDQNWPNPFVFALGTEGNFTFWPRPEKAGAAGEVRAMSAELRLVAEGFESLSHFFEFEVTAEKEAKEEFSLLHIHKLPDLYVFPVGSAEGEDY